MKKTFKKINTEKELTKFLNSAGITRKLNTRKNLILDNGKDVRIRVTKNGGSFTDMRNINIGVPYDELMGKTQGRVALVLDGLTIHECYHILRTNSELWNKFITDCAELFVSEYNVPEQFAKSVAKDILNGVEDGRIERIASDDSTYQAKCLALTNATLFSTDNVITKKESAEKELSHTIFCFCTYAVLGIPAYGYPTVYKDNMK